MSRHLYEKRDTVGYSMTQQGGEIVLRSGLFSRRIAPCIFTGLYRHSPGNRTLVTFINDYFKLLEDCSVRTGNAEL